MANSLPMTVAQSGPILFAHCSHRFLSHGFHMVLPEGRPPFVEYLLEADAGRSRCVQEPGVFVPDLERVRPDPQVHGGADVRVRGRNTSCAHRRRGCWPEPSCRTPSPSPRMPPEANAISTRLLLAFEHRQT